MISSQTHTFSKNESYTFNLSAKTLSLGVITIYQKQFMFKGESHKHSISFGN